jgi:hypothetical protein
MPAESRRLRVDGSFGQFTSQPCFSLPERIFREKQAGSDDQRRRSSLVSSFRGARVNHIGKLSAYLA